MYECESVRVCECVSARVCECKSVDFCVRQCMGDRVNANIVRGSSLLCIFLHFLLKSGFGPALIIVVRNNFPDRYFDCALVWSLTELLNCCGNSEIGY